MLAEVCPPFLVGLRDLAVRERYKEIFFFETTLFEGCDTLWSVVRDEELAVLIDVCDRDWQALPVRANAEGTLTSTVDGFAHVELANLSVRPKDFCTDDYL